MQKKFKIKVNFFFLHVFSSDCKCENSSMIDKLFFPPCTKWRRCFHCISARSGNVIYSRAECKYASECPRKEAAVDFHFARTCRNGRKYSHTRRRIINILMENCLRVCFERDLIAEELANFQRRIIEVRTVRVNTNITHHTWLWLIDKNINTNKQMEISINIVSKYSTYKSL